MAIKMHVRQIQYRNTLLDAISSATTLGLDSALSAINSELTEPGRLIASQPNSLVVHIGSATVINPITLRARTLPPINNLTSPFTGGTITFPSADAGTIVVSPGTNGILNCPSSKYTAILVQLDQAGNLNIVVGLPYASLGAVIVPGGNTSFLSLGYIVVHNVAGTIQNVADTNLTQFVGGGGSGGSGTGNPTIETLKNMFVDSPFGLMTPNIFQTDAATKIDNSSTATFSLTTSNVAFSSAGQFLVSTQMLDPTEFLASGLDVGSIDLVAFWNTAGIDPAATYQVSRNGGFEYQTVPMQRIGLSTEVFEGVHVFAPEAAKQIVSTYANSNSDTNTPLNASTSLKLSESFVLATAQVGLQVKAYVNKIGSPAGNLLVSIYSNNAGSPGTLLTQSAPVLISGMSAGLNTLTIAMPATVMAAGTYHLVLEGDAGYQASFVSTTTELDIRSDSSSPTAAIAKKWNGSAWSTVAGTALVYEIDGRALDLRVKITSSTSAVSLDAYGIFYNLSGGQISNSNIPNREIQSFDGIVDNTSTFTLTSFMPDPALLKVYEVMTGQVYRYGAFALNGNQVIFPANTFQKPGTISLLFDQDGSGSFDNSDLNAALLAANFLGSTDPSIDRSQSGRGIFLRRPDGTLREITIDNSDNLVVWSV